MPLPVIPLATGSLQLAGQTVEYRALSASEAIKLGGFPAGDGVGNFIVSKALGISVEEAAAWLDATPVVPATELLNAIILLSGLENEVQIGPKA